MLKYAILGFLLSGLFTMEDFLTALPMAGALVPDLGLLFILAYSARGRGRILAPICFLSGWMKGIQGSEPAGVYMLAYLTIAFILFNTRTLFFLDRFLTQFVLGLFYAFIYWILLAACRGLELLPEYSMERLQLEALGCLSAACTAPLVFPLYDRLVTMRKLLHP
jgi:rod shape-determining protein MreD